MAYLGATTSDAKANFLKQFSGAAYSTDKYGAFWLVTPYGKTGNVTEEKWYEVPASVFPSLGLGASDEYFFYAKSGAKYFVKESYLDLVNYQPTSVGGETTKTASSGGFNMMYLYAGAGLLGLLVLIKVLKK